MKLKLANLPSRIEKLKLLSEELGVNLYVKRDDMTGLELSGNKIRKLEYSLSEAKKLGADVIVTFGAIQSNHCRATAAACAKLGLECHLVLSADKPESYEGNLFLNALLGGHIHFIGDSDMKAYGEELGEKFKSEGRTPYFIPIGASNATGSLGYVEEAGEIIQWEEENVTFDLICLAVGSGGTYAGLFYGMAEAKRDVDICGFSVSSESEVFVGKIGKILGDMGMERLDRSKIWIDDEYVGLGYGKTTSGELELIGDVARKEGIILDPCYTGKAFIGMVDRIERGDFSKYKNILYIHTGGAFGWTKEHRDMFMDL